MALSQPGGLPATIKTDDNTVPELAAFADGWCEGLRLRVMVLATERPIEAGGQ
jgi:hypothetical protein